MPTSSTWRWRTSTTPGPRPTTLTNGICERFHKTLQDECYSLLSRKKLYRSLEELQVDLDAWLQSYNREQPHWGGLLLEDPLGDVPAQQAPGISQRPEQKR